MDTHAFPGGVKVQRFCLTLVGEDRLRYESLRPIALDWNGLQNQFRQQYSKIRNPREHLFHACRSFHFDESIETLDAYATHIRKVAASLVHGKPQVSEIFKNTFPVRIYWVLFPMEDLRVAVETAKNYFQKKKMDRQLVGQSPTPFMNI